MYAGLAWNADKRLFLCDLTCPERSHLEYLVIIAYKCILKHCRIWRTSHQSNTVKIPSSPKKSFLLWAVIVQKKNAARDWFILFAFLDVVYVHDYMCWSQQTGHMQEGKFVLFCWRGGGWGKYMCTIPGRQAIPVNHFCPQFETSWILFIYLPVSV